MLLRRSFQEGKWGPHIEHRLLHHTKILATPANTSCSVAHQLQGKKATQRSLTGRAAHKRAKPPGLPAGYLTEVGASEPKIARKQREG